jgi:CBS domain-containing protein
MKVENVMIALDKFPVITEKFFFKEALDEMNEKKLGIACIVDENSRLKGILTDGDVRRKLLKVQKPLSALFVDDCMEHAILSPIIINPETSLVDAIEIMGNHKIWDLPVVDNDGKLMGLLHLHPVVKNLLNYNSPT